MNVESNKDTKTVINTRQLTSIIASTIIGVGVLTLPRDVAGYAKQSASISIIVGIFIAMVGIVIITALCRRFPNLSFFSFSIDILGFKKKKWIGKILSYPIMLILLSYWVLSTVMVTRIFGEVVVTTVLPATPLEIIILSMLFAALIFTLHGVEVMAKVNEILLPIIVVPVLLISIWSFQSAKLYHILPLFHDINWRTFFIGILISSFAFQGFEIKLVLSEYVRQDSNIYRSNILGIAIPGFIYTLIVISGIAVFGVEELAFISWPTLELVKVTEFPGLILERMESAFLGVWVTAVFSTTANSYLVTSLLIKQILHLKNYKIWAFIIFPILYWLSLGAENLYEVFSYQNIVAIIGGLSAFVVPAILLCIAIMRKKGAHSP